MDTTIAVTFIKIIIFLPLVLLLAYLSLKVGGKHMMGFNSRVIRVVEKVSLSNKTSLCVVVIDGKPYVVSSSDEKVEILMELPKEVLDKAKQGETSFKESLISNFNLLLNRKDKL